jgi:tRNA dimethylallyltransferase
MSAAVSRAANSKIVLIAGPTASGKSALALALAERLGGAIINADSMQVYRDLRIITARPSEDDLKRAPHYLYGHVPASEAYSAGRFVVEAEAAIKAAKSRGSVPILVGGTGLYFAALIEGLSPIPPTDPGIRQFWRNEAARLGAAALHATLAKRDPVTAERLAPSDAQRVVRALEVFDTTGRSLSDWRREKGAPLVDLANSVPLLLNPDRAMLHKRTDARIDRMVADGALNEAAAFASLGLEETLPAMRAIGVRPLIAAAKKQATLMDALDAAKAETRQYVKRQQTWFRSKMIAWNNVNTQEIERITQEAIAFIDC